MNATVDGNRVILHEGSRGFGSFDIGELMKLNEEEIARVIDLRIAAASSEKGLDSPS